MENEPGHGVVCTVPVAHVLPGYPPSMGGAERVAQSLVRLRQKNRSTIVLTARDPRPSQSADDDAEKYFVRRFRSLELSGTKIMPGLAGALLRLPRGTVIHLHITSAYLPEVVYAAHVVRGLPYVAHLHFDIATAGAWAGPVLRRAWMPAVLPRVLRAAGAVVVYTESQRKTVISCGVDPARVSITRNGVDASFFCDDIRTLPTRPRLLFAGRLAAEKNVPLLLQALTGMPGRFDTTIVGEGPAECDLRRQAAELGLTGLHFRGWAAGAQLRAAYRSADIFVSPSRSEGMSLAVLEALASGLPVVATDLESTRQLVIHGESGLLTAADDARALRAALLQIASDADAYEHMSRTARKVAGQYEWPAIAADFERVYERALQSGTRPSARILVTGGLS